MTRPSMRATTAALAAVLVSAAASAVGAAAPPVRIALLGVVVDVQTGYVRVSEVIRLQNATAQTFVGHVEFALPDGARYITYHEGLQRPTLQHNVLTNRLTIPPSGMQVSYGYTVAGHREVSLGRALTLPVDRVEIFVTAPARASAPRLQSGLDRAIESRNFTRATGSDFPAGPFPMVIHGVPARRDWGAASAAGALGAALLLGLVAATMTTGRPPMRRS